jgi:hypothetical protein
MCEAALINACESPSDLPWAYINTATQRIYARQYQEAQESATDGNEYDQKLSYERVASGDELHLRDLPGLWRAAGLTGDLIAVLRARAEGRHWRELAEYLTNQSGKSFTRSQVEASRGKLRRLQNKLCATALAASQWRRRSSHATIYRERVPDGGQWKGLWAYAHAYEGEELEILREIVFHERRRLFREN